MTVLIGDFTFHTPPAQGFGSGHPVVQLCGGAIQEPDSIFSRHCMVATSALLSIPLDRKLWYPFWEGQKTIVPPVVHSSNLSRAAYLRPVALVKVGVRTMRVARHTCISVIRFQ